VNAKTAGSRLPAGGTNVTAAYMTSLTKIKVRILQIHGNELEIITGLIPNKCMNQVSDEGSGEFLVVLL
jgi:hypothetical protein